MSDDLKPGELNSLEVLSLIYDEFGSQNRDKSFAEYVDTRFEGTFDVLKRSAIKSLEDHILGSGDSIFGIVLRPDEKSKAPISITSPLSTMLKKVLNIPSPRLGYARIKVLKTPHTDIFTDPLTYDGTFEDYARISAFPLFAYELGLGLQAGSFVRGTFDFGTLRSGLITAVTDDAHFALPSASQIASLASKNYNSASGAADASAAAGNFPIPSNFPINTPSSILEGAKKYDSDPDVPNKPQHASILGALHPDFANNVKSFMYDAWKKNDASIQLNSGYRSSKKQARLLREWEARGQTGPRPTSGLSYHNLGMAIDFNPTINGNTLGSRSTKQQWFDSGIVRTGEENGLYWGGRFRTNYDPIHFDFRQTLPLTKRVSHVKKSAAAGVSPNRQSLA